MHVSVSRISASNHTSTADARTSQRRNPNGLEFTEDDLVDIYDELCFGPPSPEVLEWSTETWRETYSAGRDHGRRHQQQQYQQQRQQEVDKVDSKRGVIDGMLTRLGEFWGTARDYINAVGGYPMGGTKGV